MFCAGCRACAGVAAETPAARRGLACPHYRVVGSCLAVKSAACAHVGCARIQACVCMCERVSLCVLQGCLGCQAARISGGGCGPARVLQLLWKRTVGHAQGLEKFVLSLWVCCVMSTWCVWRLRHASAWCSLDAFLGGCALLSTRLQAKQCQHAADFQ